MGCLSSKHANFQEGPKSVQPVKSLQVSGTTEELESSRTAILSLLGTKQGGHLVDRNGKKVKIDDLQGHTIALLFSAHAVPQAREFTRLLSQVYKEIHSKNKPFEVIFISNDESLPIWKESMKEMPWLAIPFSDKETVDNLGAKFEISDIPTLIILSSEARRICGDGVDVIQKFGSKSWPFSMERVEMLRREEQQELERQKRSEQTQDVKQDETGHSGNNGRNSLRDNQVAPEY